MLPSSLLSSRMPVIPGTLTDHPRRLPTSGPSSLPAEPLPLLSTVASTLPRGVYTEPYVRTTETGNPHPPHGLAPSAT